MGLLGIVDDCSVEFERIKDDLKMIFSEVFNRKTHEPSYSLRASTFRKLLQNEISHGMYSR